MTFPAPCLVVTNQYYYHTTCFGFFQDLDKEKKPIIVGLVTGKKGTVTRVNPENIKFNGPNQLFHKDGRVDSLTGNKI